MNQSLSPLLLTHKETAMGAAEQEADLRRIFTEDDPLTFKSKRDEALPLSMDTHMRSFSYHDVCLSPDSRFPWFGVRAEQ